jgi:hypothetical protein
MTMTLGSAARLAIVGLLCVPMLACSVASYRKPVDDFAQATRDTAESFAALDKQVIDAEADLIRRGVMTNELLVRQRTGDCLTESARCQLVVVDRDNKEQPLAPVSRMPRMLALMGSIQRYADGLSAIVNADTAAQVTTQVNATVVSVKNLAATVSKLGGPDNTSGVSLAEYATPVGNLANWLAGQYIARVQLDGLRRATADARPVVSGAMTVFGIAADEASLIPRGAMAKEVAERLSTLRTTVNERNIQELAAAASRYDRLLVGNPPSVFKQLDQSHEALVAKIQDENVSLSDVIARIETFAATAKELAGIVKELHKVEKK